MAVAFGRYQLLKKIASGGMGQVFLARTAQAGFEKLVVIKRILPHLVEDEEFLDMFFDEARIAARLNHPNLVQIFELGDVEGMHFLAMEYVQGDDVRRVEKQSRKQQRPMPLGVTCRIIADAAAGLDYAHKLKDSQGRPLSLIHRDVSPQNILVSFDGGVKLIDFGVARAAGRAQHTATGILKGKYPYMSPEQIAGEAYDHRSDQFALATVFWEILTGRRLFKGDSDFVTMRLVRECNVPAPSSINAALPKELDAIVLKALSPKAQHRFVDAGELRMALEDFTVSAHLAATPAHLAAHMRGLYSERIERESDLSSLDELTGPSAFDEESAPSRPSNSRASAHAPLTRGGAAAAAPIPSPLPLGDDGPRPTREMTMPVVRKRSRLPVPVIAGATLLVLAAVALAVPLALRSSRAQPTTTVVAVPIEEPYSDPTKPLPESEPEPKPVTINVTSTPSGAEVLVDGQRVGVTPLSYTLPSGTEAADAVLRLDGYEPQHAVLSASGGPELSVTLQPLPVTPPHRKPSTKKRNDAPTLGIKTGR